MSISHYMDLRTEIGQFCSNQHLQLNTDLGQHFLVDGDVLQSIVDAATITNADHVVEIGPGIGVLTRELVSRAKHVTAIELDDRLIPLLLKFTQNPKNLEVIQKNALHTDFPTDDYKIVANIPYHITSPLLRHAFLESKTQPTSLTLLIQREVAEKISDPTDAGMLTVLVGLFGSAKLIRLVKPEAFLPPPKVDSAVLHVQCFDQPKTDAATIEQIFALTKLGFGQKRKMLRNTIGSLPNGMETMEEVGIEATRRPQTLSVDEWITLAKAFLAK